MKMISVTELRSRLRHHLGSVKAGEEILIFERKVPIARIVPLWDGNDADDELIALATQGKIRLGTGTIDESFWKMPAPRLTMKVLARVVEQERDED